jgi:lysophospholipase L1-like esterase
MAFGFLSRVFPRPRGLLAILLILGWAIPAQFIELSKTSQRAPIDSSRRAKPVTYLALGDSTGLGLGAQNGYGYVEQLMTRIETERPGSRLLKLCTLGETTTSLRQRLTESFSLKPTLVTLSIGMNDLFGRISEQEFAANYEAIIIRLRRLAVPIVITNLPDISFAPRLPNSMREEIHVKVLLFNKQIEAIAKRYGLFFVDLYSASAKTLSKHREFFASDGFHPSHAGYEFWTRTMWPTVRNAIQGSAKSGRGVTLSFSNSSGYKNIQMTLKRI